MNQSSTTQILVIRHGETVWNSLGKQQGHLDSPLSELGLAQARAIAAGLTSQKFDILYSSDLGRAATTAEILGKRLGLPVQLDQRLRERHLGTLQGLTMTEFRERHPDEHASLARNSPERAIPGGESLRQHHDRVVACAGELASRHVGQNVGIVTHGGVMQILFRHVVGLAMDAPRHFSLFNASISAFSVTDGIWKLERWGDTHHLQGLNAMDDW